MTVLEVAARRAAGAAGQRRRSRAPRSAAACGYRARSPPTPRWSSAASRAGRACVVRDGRSSAPRPGSGRLPETPGFDRTVDVAEGGDVAARPGARSRPTVRRSSGSSRRSSERQVGSRRRRRTPAIRPSSVRTRSMVATDTSWYASPLDDTPGTPAVVEGAAHHHLGHAVLGRDQPGTLPEVLVVDPLTTDASRSSCRDDRGSCWCHDSGPDQPAADHRAADDVGARRRSVSASWRSTDWKTCGTRRTRAPDRTCSAGSARPSRSAAGPSRRRSSAGSPTSSRGRAGRGAVRRRRSQLGPALSGSGSPT